MQAFTIPWHVAARELRGNNVTIPRETQLATCFPLGDTVYYLPKLIVDPSPGSYMPGRILMLRTYTAFQITLTAAAGDNIMGSSSINMPGGNLVILVYIAGNEWQIMANISGGSISMAGLAAREAVPEVSGKSEDSCPGESCTADPRPMTPVRSLPKK